MGYVPDLHKILVGTSDQQLMALSNEFPGFYRYALIMVNSNPTMGCSKLKLYTVCLVRRMLFSSESFSSVRIALRRSVF